MSIVADVQKRMEPLIKPIRHVYEWPLVTIGNNFDALLYAHKNKSHFILNDKYDYLSYDELDQRVSLPGFVGWELGTKVESVYGDIAFELGFAGLAPFGQPCSIDIEPEKNMLIVSYKGRGIPVRYEHLRIFDVNNVSGLPFKVRYEILSHRVCDRFKINRADTSCVLNSLVDHEYDLARKIIPTDRRKFRAESLVPAGELDEFDWSTNMVRIKSRQMLANDGFFTHRSKNWTLEQIADREVCTDKFLEYKKKGNIEVGIEDTSMWRKIL